MFAFISHHILFYTYKYFIVSSILSLWFSLFLFLLHFFQEFPLTLIIEPQTRRIKKKKREKQKSTVGFIQNEFINAHTFIDQIYQTDTKKKCFWCDIKKWSFSVFLFSQYYYLKFGSKSTQKRVDQFCICAFIVDIIRIRLWNYVSHVD